MPTGVKLHVEKQQHVQSENSKAKQHKIDI